MTHEALEKGCEHEAEVSRYPLPPLPPPALAPYWDKDMSFNISVPELCLIRFCVRDQTGFLSSDFVGQYTLPFSSLQRGEARRRRGRGRGEEVWGSITSCDRH